MSGRTSPNLECEIKLALSADQYHRLRDALGGPISEVRQHNLFLDTGDRQLSAGRWALRLRLEELTDETSRLIVTLKGPATKRAGAVQRTEIEGPADDTLWKCALAGDLHPEAIKGAPGEFLRRDLALRGTLGPVLRFSNHRTTFGVTLDGSDRLVELDRTQYATGEIDHELELELEPTESLSDTMATLEIHAAYVSLSDLLTTHGIEATRSVSGKFSRGLHYAARD
jgi:inorganic triphosphatase YgiF